MGPVPIVNAPRFVGDPPVLVAEAAASAKVLGWAPAHSDLEEIVRTAARWHEKGR